ncbi:DEAD/DEAH box helicase [Carpediemonas membranifera]|uniref:ATP-dependent RNA helicase n=1 Tax=Carpediemonas membranifera TaxID=201153 RepID=A0A8J6B4M4_9EUKA|nr:DEAD/DEAH box helicase [Carpediemonas membranifera]|eukprot:KAG9395598.1 DEAD/DEAH box helicase [Carpediemonas membranifera]
MFSLLAQDKNVMVTADAVGGGKLITGILHTVLMKVFTQEQVVEGTKAIILCPTREEATQVVTIAKRLRSELLRKPKLFAIELLIGGTDVSTGTDIIVATPDSLYRLDHVRSKDFPNLKILAVVGANRIMDIYPKQSLDILVNKSLPVAGQTILLVEPSSRSNEDLVCQFSRDVEQATSFQLARIPTPAGQDAKLAKVEVLSSPYAARLGTLFAFIAKEIKQTGSEKRAIIALSSADEVRFFSQILAKLATTDFVVKSEPGPIDAESSALTELADSPAGLCLVTSTALTRATVNQTVASSVHFMLQLTPAPTLPALLAHGRFTGARVIMFLDPKEEEPVLSALPADLAISPCDWSIENAKVNNARNKVVKRVQTAMVLQKLAQQAFHGFISEYSLPRASVMPQLKDIVRLYGLDEVVKVSLPGMDMEASGFVKVERLEVKKPVKAKKAKRAGSKAAEAKKGGKAKRGKATKE